VNNFYRTEGVGWIMHVEDKNGETMTDNALLERVSPKSLA
jgi:hypothetical protein